MFHRMRSYPLIHTGEQSYRPRVYGDPQLGGTWNGYLVFFPLSGSSAIATDRETTQGTFEALRVWADGLSSVYVEGALVRALELADPPGVLTQLEEAEYEALEDAERLESAAEMEHLAAAASEEAIATDAVEVHLEAAREARAVATKAAQRSRKALDEANRPTLATSRAGKKK